MNPRLFLVLIGWGLAFVAWQTIKYPPAYLALSSLWAAAAAVCAASCMIAAVIPARWLVATSGATLVCSALGRSVGIAGQLVTNGVGRPQLPSFTIAATTWALVALLSYSAWKHYVTPWSMAHRWTHDG